MQQYCVRWNLCPAGGENSWDYICMSHVLICYHFNFISSYKIELAHLQKKNLLCKFKFVDFKFLPLLPKITKHVKDQQRWSEISLAWGNFPSYSEHLPATSSLNPLFLNPYILNFLNDPMQGITTVIFLSLSIYNRRLL